MEFIHLERSGFRRLKLLDDSSLRGIDNAMIKKIAKYLQGQQVKELNVETMLEHPFIVTLLERFIQEYSSNAKKDPVKSVNYRNLGNEVYRKKQFAEASYYYTMAILFAPNVPENGELSRSNLPEELSLAFGNRSAVFFKLQKHEDCLVDIDHSLATGYPRSKLPKLLLRKVECLISLGRLSEAKTAWEQFSRLESKEGDDVNDGEGINRIRLQLQDIETPMEDCQSSSQDGKNI